MAKKNAVQFPPGLSLPAFLKHYGSEEQCREALIQPRWPKGFCCPDCGHTGHCRLKARAVFQCNRCKCQVSPTSGTLFADTKLPLRDLVPRHRPADPAQERHLGTRAATATAARHATRAEPQRAQPSV